MHKDAPNNNIVPTVINGQSGRLYRNKRLSTRRCLRFNGGSIYYEKKKMNLLVKINGIKSTNIWYFCMAHD